MPEKDEASQTIWKTTFENDFKEVEEIGRFVSFYMYLHLTMMSFKSFAIKNLPFSAGVDLRL